MANEQDVVTFVIIFVRFLQMPNYLTHENVQSKKGDNVQPSSVRGCCIAASVIAG